MQIDAISPQFFFDTKANRYRYKDSKKFAPKRAIVNLTRKYIEDQKAELISLADKLESKKVDLIGFQREAAAIVKQIHLSQLLLGRNGIENIKPEDFLAIARELKKQYFSGVGTDGKAYGLKYLAKDIKDGKVTIAQLRNRLRMFADSGRLSYWYGLKESAKDKGKTHAVRVLGDAKHCKDCPRLAGEIKLIDKILLPGQGCECLTQCKCRLRIGTLKELKRGAIAA